jgi:hypothetical protein
MRHPKPSLVVAVRPYGPVVLMSGVGMLGARRTSLVVSVDHAQRGSANGCICSKQ